MTRVDAELARLATLSPAGLAEAWRRVCRSEPPRLPDELLRLAIAHRIQARSFGGLSAVRLRALRSVGENGGTPSLKPGTRLVRRWHDCTISVLVTEEGFLCDGRCYTSLSAIAHEVTGAAWSGPRFFGLRSPRSRESANG